MKRAAAVLFVLLLAAPVPAQDETRIRALLQRLDDDSIEVRSSAAVDLAKLGKASVPLLRRAASDAGPETRDRLAEIIRKIEERERLTALLPPPSRITLEARNRPLHEVFEEFARQSRTPIDLTGIPDDSRVTVTLKKAPFWAALEELCRASGRVMATPDGDHVAVTAEPYVALPQLTTDHFHVTLQRIDLTSNGTLGQPDRFEHFEATFDASWEKGARPWRITARIVELIDEMGDDLTGMDSEITLTSIAPDAIHEFLTLEDSHGPGPQASKISRMKVEVSFDFPLRYAELRLPVADGKLPPLVECPEFSVRVLRLDRVEGSWVAQLSLTPGATPPEGDLVSDSIVLKDAKGVDHAGQIKPEPPTPDNETRYEIVFAGSLEPAQLKEIVIRIPAELHRERLEVDLKDILLK